jgi:hypothetical protein
VPFWVVPSLKLLSEKKMEMPPMEKVPSQGPPRNHRKGSSTVPLTGSKERFHSQP